VAIRAIIVDIGGVVLVREETPAHRRWEARFGFPPGGFARGLFRPDLSARATVGAVSAAHVWDDMASRLSLDAADVEELRRDFFAGERLNEPFAAFLQTLRPAYRTAALSNAWSGTREAITRHYGIDRLVDLLIFSDEEGMAKPDPRIYRLAVERLGVRPEEALFVDDVLPNVEGARAVGMLAVHFRDTAQAIADVARHRNREGRQIGENCRGAENAEDAKKERGKEDRSAETAR
jgi:epoxide hydrolase-like predicted phosphatase